MEHSKKMKMKNILVTGGAGFIGSNIVKSLRDSGHKIVVFDNFSRGKNKNIKNISFINGDVRDREKVFKIFQRLHSQTEFMGTGIGLSICKKIAELHGGYIEAQGFEGEGATFSVYLPVEHLTK